MKKFIVTYHANPADLAKSANASPEEMKKGMEPWKKWAENCGQKLVDLGTPLMGGQKLKPNGGTENSSKEICGYSILEAKDMEEAKSLLKAHPHLQWTEGCSIEVHESMPLPG